MYMLLISSDSNFYEVCGYVEVEVFQLTSLYQDVNLSVGGDFNINFLRGVDFYLLWTTMHLKKE